MELMATVLCFIEWQEWDVARLSTRTWPVPESCMLPYYLWTM